MSSDLSPELQALATQYLHWDPNPITRLQLQSLLDNNNTDELNKKLKTRMAFGTAGLRAPMNVGYNCMNELTIIQTTQGLVKYLLEKIPNCVDRGVVIGYDGRHNSNTYANISAKIFNTYNIPVYLFNRYAATPLIPFTVKEKNCALGIVVTASHNPKEDNGFKVFWENGAQIIPPHDSGIANSILLNLEPQNTKDGIIYDPTDEMTELYYKRSLKHCYHFDENPSSKLKIAYTAMHGIGYYWTKKAFEAFNLPPFYPVPLQVEPDPEFPTVKFPNPEEGKGALKLAMETAEKNDCEIILANDPDADRLAVAEKSGSSYRPFNGNEIAVLLSDWAWTNHKRELSKLNLSEAELAEKYKKCVMLASTVSSKYLAAMAEKEGFTFVDTLTGFKWMGNVAQSMETKGYTFLFAYEVEIGFLVGNNSFDKDGVRIAAIFAEMASQLYKQGKNCASHLKDLYTRYGYFNMNTSYFFCYDSATFTKIFNRLRHGENDNYLKHVDDEFSVSHIRDISLAVDTRQPDGKSILPQITDSHMITYWFPNGSTVTFRNSGTEPKLKYYVESNSKNSMEEAHEITQRITNAILTKFLEPELNHLVPPKRD